MPADTITTATLLIIVEPCVAIISVCLPGIQPIPRDIASWSIIEYMKIVARFQTAMHGERASDVEIADIPLEPPSPATKPRQQYQEGNGGEVIEASSDYEDGDEDLYPDGPVMIKGRLMNV